MERVSRVKKVRRKRRKSQPGDERPHSSQPVVKGKPDVVLSEENLMMLQRTYGNAYVQQVVQRDASNGAHGKGCGCAVCGGGRVQRSVDQFMGKGGVVQRDVPSLANWKKSSATDKDGKGFTWRSNLLGAVDKGLEGYHKARGIPEQNFGLKEMNTLVTAISTYLEKKDAKSRRRPAVVNLQKEALSEQAEVKQMVKIKQDIFDKYAITLDNSAGLAALKMTYENDASDEEVLKKLTGTRWKLNDLQAVASALSIYGPLLGENRPKELGKQQISTFSRLDGGVERTGSGLKEDSSMLAETYRPKDKNDPNYFDDSDDPNVLNNTTVFTKGTETQDFVKDPHNPSKEALQKGYIGTVIHELCHGLIDLLPPPGNAPAKMDNGDSISNMLDYFTYQMAYWKSREQKSRAKGAEKPITAYGKMTPQEDLAESVMYFFQDPGRLKSECPERFTFISANVSQYLDEGAVQKAQEEAQQKNPDVVMPSPSAADSKDPEKDTEKRDNKGAKPVIDVIKQGINNGNEVDPDLDKAFTDVAYQDTQETML